MGCLHYRCSSKNRCPSFSDHLEQKYSNFLASYYAWPTITRKWHNPRGLCCPRIRDFLPTHRMSSSSSYSSFLTSSRVGNYLSCSLYSSCACSAISSLSRRVLSSCTRWSLIEVTCRDPQSQWHGGRHWKISCFEHYSTSMPMFCIVPHILIANFFGTLAPVAYIETLALKNYNDLSYSNASFNLTSNISFTSSPANCRGFLGTPPNPSSMKWFKAYLVPPMPALTIAQSASATVILEML